MCVCVGQDGGHPLRVRRSHVPVTSDAIGPALSSAAGQVLAVWPVLGQVLGSCHPGAATSSTGPARATPGPPREARGARGSQTYKQAVDLSPPLHEQIPITGFPPEVKEVVSPCPRRRKTDQ